MNWFGAFAIAWAVAACSVSRPTFECADWSDCGPGGACEPETKACSFADASCTATGRRFSAISPEPFRDRCVEYVPEAPAGGLCNPAAPTCARFRDCLGNRCVSTAELQTGRLLSCARCATQGPSGPLFCWGETALLSPFEPVYLSIPGYDCRPNPNQPPPRLFCPVECGMCLGNEANPALCPVTCQGANVTVSHAVGDNHICFYNGRTYCIGSHATLQLGAGEPDLPLPVPLATVRLDATLQILAAGAKHTCGRGVQSDRVMCWGSNEFGQLALDGVPGPDVAVPVGNAPFPTPPGGTIIGVDFVAVSEEFSCAASNDQVRCWGATPWPPGLVPDLPPGQITDFDVGSKHACVVKGGHVICWGGNRSGQAAPVMASILAAPTSVLPDLEVTRVVTGRQHSCAIANDGAIWCWGATDKDQLDGAVGPGPVQIRRDPPAVGPMAAGADVTCTIHADDRVRCWGDVLERQGVAYRDFSACDR